MGILAEDVLKNADLDNPVFSVQLSIQKLMEHINHNIKYKPIAKFPAVKRDLAVLADKNLAIQDLKNLIYKNGGKLLNTVKLFDLYQGDQIPGTKKSLAFSLEFISEERTLKEKEIEPIMSSIVRELERTYQCTLRS